MTLEPLAYQVMTASIRSLIFFGLAFIGTQLAWRPVQSLPAEGHRAVTVRALRGQIQHGTLLAPELKELIDFYRWFGWSLVARGGDEAGKARFRSQYSDPRSFDGLGVRRLLSLSLNPKITVFGVTEVTAAEEPDRFSALADATTRPRRDHRCRDRVVQSSADSFGGPASHQAVPVDPRVLNWGPSTGPGSDEWASAALPPGMTSTVDDGDTGLWVASAYEGVPVHGGAATMAQVHMDMSALTLNWGDTEFKQVAEYLSLVWLGASLHYIQEAADPLNTVQLGAPSMRRWLATRRRRSGLKSLGGWWSPWSLHIQEGLTLRRRLREAADQHLEARLHEILDGDDDSSPLAKALKNMARGDEAWDAAVRPALQPWLQPPKEPEPSAKGRGAASVIVDTLAAAGFVEGAEGYDLLMALTRVSSSPNVDLSKPLQFYVETPEERRHLARLERIQANGLLRAASATRLAFDGWLHANPHAALDRVRRVRTLGLMREADAVASWRSRPMTPRTAPRASPWWGMCALIAPLALVGWRWRRAARRSV